MKKYLLLLIVVILVVFFGIIAIVPIYASGLEKVVLSLDTEEAEAGNLPDKVIMTIKTNEPIIPIQLSGEAYSSNDGIKIIDILDGDKELCSNSKTGRFAWMNANNEKEVTEFATIVYDIPKDLPAGTYTFGVRYASATDRTGDEILTTSEQNIIFTVKSSANAAPKNAFNMFSRLLFPFRWHWTFYHG